MKSFKEPTLPKVWGLVMALAFIGFFGFLLFMALSDLEPKEPMKNLKEHNPEIFYK